MKVTAKNDKLYVVSPYDTRFVKGARQINGKWESPAWVFPLENEPQVRSLLKSVYGTDGTPETTVTLTVALADLNLLFDDRFMVGPIEVLKKYDRDSAPKVGDGCTVVQGKLLSAGGSRNNPRITFTNDCVLRVKNVPQSVANALVTESSAYQILPDDSPVKPTFTDQEQSTIDFLRTLTPERLSLVLKEIK